MKNYFLLVLIILILVSVDHPSIAKPRQKFFDNFMNMLSESGEIKRDQAAKHAYREIIDKLRLGQNQKDHLAEQLKTNNSMSAFKSRFCDQGELNSYFYGDDLRQVCKVISNKIAEYKK